MLCAARSSVGSIMLRQCFLHKIQVFAIIATSLLRVFQVCEMLVKAPVSDDAVACKHCHRARSALDKAQALQVGGPCNEACALLSSLRSVSGPSAVVNALYSIQSRASL